MAANPKLKRAVTNALKEYIGLDEDERLLIIADENKRDIAMIMLESAKKICGEVVYVEMPQAEHENQRMMGPIGEMMKGFDTVVSVATKSIYRTKARKEASQLGIRVVSMPDISEGTITRCLSGKPDKLIDLTALVARNFKGVQEIRVTSFLGTNIVMPVRKRRIMSYTGVLTNIGESGIVPSGVVHIAPTEKRSDGIIVFDGSITGVGKLKSPVKVDIIKGRITKIDGKTDAKKLQKIFDEADEDATVLAKFGIGTNPKATVCGVMVEDEHSLGSVHISFGDNSHIGGKTNSESYIAGVIKKPTIYFDDIIIMDEGELVLE
jgi:aminopeptidase